MTLLTSLIPAIAILVLAAVVVFAIKRLALERRDDESSVGPPHPWPFESRPPLTAIEQTLYFRLVKSLPECVVLAQVPLSSFLFVKKGNNFQAWNNRINRMSVDYLVCLQDMTIVAAIELDDKTQERTMRQVADEKKNAVLQDANVHLVRWRASALPSDEEIRQAFAH
jgi:Protein of unknown function (DUF2726)